MTKNDDKKNNKNEKRKAKSESDSIVPIPKKPRRIPIFYEIIDIGKQNNYDNGSGGGGNDDNIENIYDDYEESSPEPLDLQNEYLDEKLENIEDFIRIGKNYQEGKYDIGLKKYD